MFRFHSSWFIDIERSFVWFDSAYRDRPDSSFVGEDDLAEIFDRLLDLEPAGIYMPVTSEAKQEFMDWDPETKGYILNPRMTWREVKGKVAFLHKCFELELRSCCFFVVKDGHLYDHPMSGWEEIIAKFGCGDDIEESIRCFVLDRFTASVFHMMKVVERGVIALQVFLANPPDPKAHFGGVISKLEDMVQKTRYSHLSPDMQAKLPFLREVLSQLHAIKDAWREGRDGSADEGPSRSGTPLAVGRYRLCSSYRHFNNGFQSQHRRVREIRYFALEANEQDGR